MPHKLCDYMLFACIIKKPQIDRKSFHSSKQLNRQNFFVEIIELFLGFSVFFLSIFVALTTIRLFDPSRLKISICRDLSWEHFLISKLSAWFQWYVKSHYVTIFPNFFWKLTKLIIFQILTSNFRKTRDYLLRMLWWLLSENLS